MTIKAPLKSDTLIEVYTKSWGKNLSEERFFPPYPLFKRLLAGFSMDKAL